MVKCDVKYVYTIYLLWITEETIKMDCLGGGGGGGFYVA